MGSIHLIRILDKEERKRAIARLLDVRDAWLSFPGHVLGVTSEHVEALQHAEPPVQFEYLSKTAPNGPTGASVQP